MRKTFCFTTLLMGITTLCFTFVETWKYVTWFSSEPDLLMFFSCLGKFMLAPCCAALVLIVGSAVLLALLRGKGTRPDGYAGMLIGAGGILALLPFLLAWNEGREADLNGGFLNYFTRYQWMAVLGAALIMAGIFAGGYAKRDLPREKENAEPETAPAPEEPAPETEHTEWRIQLYCTVMDIRGDYALIKYDDTGVESEVAIALLPFGIDTGDRLKYENYEFSQI